MEMKQGRSSRHEPTKESEPMGFQWVDIYPLIGLVGLAGYLILG
jgi:hypothetical protein